MYPLARHIHSRVAGQRRPTLHIANVTAAAAAQTTTATAAAAIGQCAACRHDRCYASPSSQKDGAKAPPPRHRDQTTVNWYDKGRKGGESVDAKVAVAAADRGRPPK